MLWRLRLLNIAPSSTIIIRARELAAMAGCDPHELLHEAIDRALRPATSRPNIKLVPYLTMLMRSIASSKCRARARAAQRGITIPFDFVPDQVPDHRSIVDPFQTIIRRDEQHFFEHLLGQLAADDPQLEKLIDAIGFGYRGAKLQDMLGVTVVELATLRRRLKRRAEAVGPFATASREHWPLGTPDHA